MPAAIIFDVQSKFKQNELALFLFKLPELPLVGD